MKPCPAHQILEVYLPRTRKLGDQAIDRLEASPLSKREIIRRLGTSPAQFYRLLDTTNYRKSVDKMLALLQVLGCEVEVIVREKSA